MEEPTAVQILAHPHELDQNSEAIAFLEIIELFAGGSGYLGNSLLDLGE